MEKIFNVLKASRQCMWVLLRSSISQKLEELAQRTAERMDKLELQDIQKILGYPTPITNGIGGS